eukprot:2097967-Pleurochrysis_carterae.AAC.1
MRSVLLAGIRHGGYSCKWRLVGQVAKLVRGRRQHCEWESSLLGLALSGLPSMSCPSCPTRLPCV